MIKSIFFGSVIEMTERKIYLPAVIAAVLALSIGIFALPAESILLSLGVIIFSIAKRRKYRPLIPVIITALALLLSVAFLAFLIYGETTGIASSSYWLMRLIFGEMR